MKKKDISQKVADYFKSNKIRKEVFATSDGFLFEAKQDAKKHAKTLKDKSVETFSKTAKSQKSEVKEVKTVDAVKNSAGQPKNPSTTGADQKTAK